MQRQSFTDAMCARAGRVFCAWGWHSWRSSVICRRECSRCHLVELLRVNEWVDPITAARFDAAMEAERRRGEELITCPCPYNRYHCMVGVCVLSASRRIEEEIRSGRGGEP